MVRLSTLLTASLAATASGLVSLGGRSGHSTEGSAWTSAAAGVKYGGESSGQYSADASTTYLHMLEQNLVDASKKLLTMDGLVIAPTSSAPKDNALLKAKVSESQRKLLMKQHEALKALLSNLKSSIKNLNKGETEGKEEGKLQVEKVKQRLEHEREELKQKNLTGFRRQLLVNRTRTDEKELEYWTRSRELQHGMFHANLKMTHGLMSKAHAVMEAYDSVMASGKLNADLAKALQAVSAGLPSKVESSSAQPKPTAQQKQPAQQKPTAHQKKSTPQKKA